MRQLTLNLLLVGALVSCGMQENSPIPVGSSTPLDSIVAGPYQLTFYAADSFPPTDIYGDLSHRLALTDSLGNAHSKAKALQSYLTQHYPEHFFTTDTTLVLLLTNGQTLSLPFWDGQKEEGFTFEHYFPSIDYYLLRVQWIEGNSWMLVNRKNGLKKYIYGLPYLSLDNKRILTTHEDLDAHFSSNGIGLYTVLSDSIQTEFTIETTFGPSDVQWIGEHEFLLKRVHLRFDSIKGHTTTTLDYARVSIDQRLEE